MTSSNKSHSLKELTGERAISGAIAVLGFMLMVPFGKLGYFDEGGFRLDYRESGGDWLAVGGLE